MPEMSKLSRREQLPFLIEQKTNELHALRTEIQEGQSERMYRRFNSLCSISNGEMTISITDNATGDYQNRRYTLVDRLFNIRDDVPDCALTPVHSFSRKRNTMPTYDNPAMLLVDRISFIPDTLVVNFESGERFESYVIQRGDGE